MNLGELFVGIKVDKNSISTLTQDVKKEMKGATDSIEGLGTKTDESVKKAEKSLGSFGESLKSIGKTILAVFAVQKIYEFGVGIITLASNLQQAQISFTTMLGSADKAGKLLKDLSDFAKTTPFELVGIRENAKQLLAMGVAHENIIPTMKALGDVAAGLSVPLDRLALAYGQVLAKGRLQGDDLRQFTEAGVPILATLATQLGKTTGEISKMIEKGQISAVEVTKAFQTMSGEGGKFANMMEKQSTTVAGKWSNLQDSINSLGESVGTKFLPSLGEAVDGLLSIVQSYGDSAGTILVDTVSTLGGIIADSINGWNSLYDVLIGNTQRTEDSQITFGQSVLWVFGVLIAGVQSIVLAFKTMGGLIGFVLYEFVARMALLGPVLSAFGENTVNVFKVVGHNIGVAFMWGIDKAIGGINNFIEYINKIPGVSIGFLKSSGDGGSFQDFGNMKNPMEGFADRSAALTKQSSADFKDFTDGVSANFIDMERKISDRNDKIFASTKNTASQIKKIPPIDLTKILGGNGGSSGASAGSEAKKQAEEVTYEIGKLKDEYTKLKNTQKEVDNLAQKNHEANMKRLEEGYTALLKIGDQIKKNETDYADSIKKIADESKKKSDEETGSYVRDQAIRQAEIEKTIKDLDKQIEDKKFIAIQDLQTKREEANKNLADVKSNIANLSTEETEALKKTLEIERQRAALSEDKRAEFDYKQKLQAIADEKAAQEALEKTKFDNDQKQLLRQQAIYEFFQKKVGMTPEQLGQIQNSDQFKGATGEEQTLILKLANELVAITDQKNKRIKLEEDVATETQRLSDLTAQKAIANVQKLKKEYQDLIAEIQSAISAQQSLEASKSTARGFADGGYTGDGATHDVAGVVHKGEYVMSQDMLGKMPGIIPALEGIRNGNTTYDQSRKVEITGPINMSEMLDFESLIRTAKFIM